METPLRRPTLVQVRRELADQRGCVAQIQALARQQDDDDEDGGAMTPFLSRHDGRTATVMLVHVDATVAEQLNALDCVASVLELPPILKLLPFARSAGQLSLERNLTAAPVMEIRLVQGSAPAQVLARLQRQLAELDGVTNVFELPARAELFPRSLFTRPLAQLELWSHAVAVAVRDAAVEWVDAKLAVSANTLRGGERGALPLAAHRRLDQFASSLVGVESAQRQGILGNDIVVGVTDSGLYMYHDQFFQPSLSIFDAPDPAARKVVYYNAWANAFDEAEEVVCGHGTHVAGLLAGSSASKQQRDLGIASAAKIAFMDIGRQSDACAGARGCPVSLETPGEAAMLLKSQMKVGAKIFSFSWGTPGSDYSSQARDLDEFIYNNPEVLIIVAAGNSGEKGQGTISSPSGAKNVISVGASLNAAESFAQTPCAVFNPLTVASFSSAGPTSDGRLKPDVVAPGMALQSSQSEAPRSTTKTAATCSLQGTSQATPVVTGMAVLLYEWLRDGWWRAGRKDPQFGMSKIPAALLKALIIHSSDSLKRRLGPLPTGPASCGMLERGAIELAYPDVYQGYGKPNMSNLVDFSDKAQDAPTLFFLPNSTAGSEPRVAEGKEVLISFSVPRGVDLRATIVWTDPPGSIRSTSQLQHDLDLSVRIRGTNRTFFPLTANPTTRRDDKNNVEMVQVSYQQLLDALQKDNATESSALVGPAGEIVVEAVVLGRSVQAADSQAFAFVASSNVIGTASGSSASPGDRGKSNGAAAAGLFGGDPFWTPWTVAGVAVGALLLLSVIVGCVRCCTARRGRAPGGAAYGTHSTPAAARRLPRVPSGLETCPYCAFATADAVVMVNHVENLHGGGLGLVVNHHHASAGAGAYSGVPVLQQPGPSPYYSSSYGPSQSLSQSQSHSHVAAPVGLNVPHARPDEQCPFCRFVSSDPVILVNHVEHMHSS
ncbi:hypothetical protein ATCC90586_004898 [Pythium insidiosum]|nr:hypothetical protein ATCC90586_004898 [Pythium insidiosum]